jgi:hypothetical protein
MNEQNQRTIDQAESILKEMRIGISKYTIKKGEIEVNITITSNHYIQTGKVIKELIKAVNDQAKQTKKYFELYGQCIADKH